jgi:hypothetical protein
MLYPAMVVSHPCDRKKSQGWGTAHFRFIPNVTGCASHAAQDDRFVIPLRMTDLLCNGLRGQDTRGVRSLRSALLRRAGGNWRGRLGCCVRLGRRRRCGGLLNRGCARTLGGTRRARRVLCCAAFGGLLGNGRFGGFLFGSGSGGRLRLRSFGTQRLGNVDGALGGGHFDGAR